MRNSIRRIIIIPIITLLFLLLPLTGCLHAGQKAATPDSPQLVLLTPLPAEYYLSASAADDSAVAARLVTQINRWMLGRGGQRSKNPEELPQVELLLKLKYSEHEEKSFAFLEKRYTLDLDGLLSNSETGVEYGNLLGRIEIRRHRFNLGDKEPEDQFDAWDEEVLRTAAKEIGERVVP